MSREPVSVKYYGGAGAWADAEFDVVLLASAGITAVVEGDAHYHAPLFAGDQVRLVVAASDRHAAREVLGGPPEGG